MSHPGSCSECGGFPGHSTTCRFNPHNPYNAAPTPTRSGTGCLGPVGCLVVLLAGAVAVAGFAFDVVMGFVAPNRGMEPLQVAAVENLVEGSWSGHVVCEDGDREMSVSFERMMSMQFDVTADVVWVGESGPIGDYLAKGTFDGVRLNMTPDGGGSGPKALALIGEVADAVASSDAGTVELLELSGDALGEQGCSGFVLGR
ncbi:MAG: hypothetical protein GX596_04925 [Propionibacterium sp.]|nr:hypothetical protein [Propionibacterium sp.]